MYSTLMVHCDLVADNTGLLQIAGELAARFNANAIGIVATRPLVPGTTDTAVPQDVIDRDVEEKSARIDAIEKAFRTALRSRRERLQFRSQIAIEAPLDYIVRQMRSADLLVTGINNRRGWLDPAQSPNTADIILQVGRPVLVLPDDIRMLAADTIVVGWKDTRATRRAVADAMPFLKLARRVVVVEAVAQDSELADARYNTRQVCEWLEAHGVVCEPNAIIVNDERTAPLATLAEREGADLIVAGAYGHSRLREWVLGGVTRGLLQQTERCVLFSH